MKIYGISFIKKKKWKGREKKNNKNFFNKKSKIS